MRVATAALVLGLSATAARADGAAVGFCEGKGANATCPVNLVQGQDYDFYFSGVGRWDDGGAALVDPSGHVVLSYWTQTKIPFGVEFRAAASGKYLIVVNTRRTFYAGLATDCRADVTTRCVLKPGDTVQGARTTVGDVDFYRVRLVHGRTYTFRCDSDRVTGIVLRDYAGRPLAQALATAARPGAFRYYAPADGDYYLKVNQGRHYTLSMR
jgi:hypothetical protein